MLLDFYRFRRRYNSRYSRSRSLWFGLSRCKSYIVGGDLLNYNVKAGPAVTTVPHNLIFAMFCLLESEFALRYWYTELLDGNNRVAEEGS